MLLRVPVKPYTLKFLTRHLGNSYKLRCDDPFGLQLFILLQKNATKSQLNAHMARYTERFALECDPNRLYRNGARNMTSLTVIYFNNFVEGIFKHEFHTYLELYCSTIGGNLAEGIRSFCQKFDLTEDDISEETLRRSYTRYQDKRRENKQKS